MTTHNTPQDTTKGDELACCPRCGHTTYFQGFAGDGRPDFMCGKCRNAWTCGDGEKYLANAIRMWPTGNCSICGGTGTINSFDGKDTGSNTAENWPAPCPAGCKPPHLAQSDIVERIKELSDVLVTHDKYQLNDRSWASFIYVGGIEVMRVRVEQAGKRSKMIRDGIAATLRNLASPDHSFARQSNGLWMCAKCGSTAGYGEQPATPSLWACTPSSPPSPQAAGTLASLDTPKPALCRECGNPRTFRGGGIGGDKICSTCHLEYDTFGEYAPQVPSPARDVSAPPLEQNLNSVIESAAEQLVEIVTDSPARDVSGTEWFSVVLAYSPAESCQVYRYTCKTCGWVFEAPSSRGFEPLRHCLQCAVKVKSAPAPASDGVSRLMEWAGKLVGEATGYALDQQSAEAHEAIEETSAAIEALRKSQPDQDAVGEVVKAAKAWRDAPEIYVTIGSPREAYYKYLLAAKNLIDAVDALARLESKTGGGE